MINKIRIIFKKERYYNYQYFSKLNERIQMQKIIKKFDKKNN